MRLLKRLPGGGFDLVSFDSDDLPRYAILSHTWTEGQEVTYNELVAGGGKEKTGYAKISFCSERAAADDLEYFWVDTCCINKSTNDELSTAINSMFSWYQGASKCYVYLWDVSVPDEITDAEAFPIMWQVAFRRSRWFTRGWTLQELLAPANVQFFCKQGKRLGNRVSLEREIHGITGIPIAALRGQPLSEFSVEERMGWAARRTTTLNEDKVYCLFGIFRVFLPLIYGEGEAYAMLRLKEEIQKRPEGRSTNSSRKLSGIFTLGKLAHFRAGRAQLTVISLVIATFSTERALCWANRRAPIPRTAPPTLQIPPANDDIWARRVREVSTCHRVCISRTGKTR